MLLSPDVTVVSNNYSMSAGSAVIATDPTVVEFTLHLS